MYCHVTLLFFVQVKQSNIDHLQIVSAVISGAKVCLKIDIKLTVRIKTIQANKIKYWELRNAAITKSTQLM